MNNDEMWRLSTTESNGQIISAVLQRYNPASQLWEDVRPLQATITRKEAVDHMNPASGRARDDTTGDRQEMIEMRGKLPSNNIIREHKFLALHKEQEQMSEQPISKEEAERLANEFLRRPVNQFYDEHYRQDNPALHAVVKYALEFARMLERRGFDSIACYYTKGSWFCAAWLGGEQVTFAESFFLYQTVAEVARRLDEAIGQHHVQHDCGYPLLKETKNAGNYETLAYRAASAGPRSKSLLECPQCQQYVQDDSVKEIADV